MLNTRLNDSCGSCPWCPGMLRAGCRDGLGGGAGTGFVVQGREVGSMRLEEVGRG